MGNFQRIGQSRWAAIPIALLLLALLGKAIQTLVSGQLNYRNYWGGLVFAPFAIVAVVLALAAAAYPFLRGKSPEKKLRGRAARRERRAKEVKYPIDDYRKW